MIGLRSKAVDRAGCSARKLLALYVASVSFFMAGAPAFAKESAAPDVKTIAFTKANEIDRGLDVAHRDISELSRALLREGRSIANQLAALSDELNKHKETLQGARTQNEISAQKEVISTLRHRLKTEIDDVSPHVKQIQDRARKLNARYANLAAQDAYKIVVHKKDAQGQETKAVIGHPRDDIEFAFQRDEIQSAALIANTALERALDAVNQANAILNSAPELR